MYNVRNRCRRHFIANISSQEAIQNDCIPISFTNNQVQPTHQPHASRKITNTENLTLDSPSIILKIRHTSPKEWCKKASIAQVNYQDATSIARYMTH